MEINANSPVVGSQKNGERFLLGLVIALAVVVGAGSWLAIGLLSHHEKARGISPDQARQLVNFSLIDSTGRNVTRAELDGKILVVSFLFTGCSLTCPEVTKRMAEIQQRTADQKDVRLVSLTVDPRSDTPPVLAKWGARFGADTNRWFMLTGDKTILHEVIGTSFLARDAGDPFNSMPGNFTGTERIAVVDQHGQVRVYFDGLRPETSAAVAAEIEKLQNEK
jgi:cytochrome oxidase Cu insertion factor (SCO1/SenC/PrrC family)